MGSAGPSLFDDPDHATPLTLEEQRDLIPAYIAYRRELNQAEQENIFRAQDWALARKRDPLSEKFIKELHKRMLGDVWKWAGKFRRTERNLGFPFYEIPTALHCLLDRSGFHGEGKACTTPARCGAATLRLCRPPTTTTLIRCWRSRVRDEPVSVLLNA